MTPWVRSALRWAVGGAVLVLILSQFDAGTVVERLSTVEIPLALPALLGLVAVHLVAALSWHRLTVVLADVRLDPGSTVRLYYAAQAFGAVTPANLGADVFRVVAVDPGAGRARLALPVAVQRLTSIAALLLLGAIGLALLPTNAASLPGGAGLLGGAGLVAATVAVMGAAVAVAALPMLASEGGGRIRRRMLRLTARLRLDPTASPGRPRMLAALRDGLGLAIVFHTISLMLGLTLVAAVDRGSMGRPLEVFGALAVARLSLAVPITPNGIGIQEGVLVVLFVGLGLPPDVALAAAVLNRLALVGTAVIGSIALLRGSGSAPVAVVGTSWSRSLDG